MSTPIAASYWSATANIGRVPPVAPDPRSTSASYWSSSERNGESPAPTLTAANRTASYWSATAPLSPLDRVTLSDAVRNSTFYNRRNVPQVHNRGDAGSAYRLSDTVAAVSGKEGHDPLSIKLSLGDGRSLDNQSNFFTTLKSRLQSIGAHLAALAAPDAFAPRRVKSLTPTVVTGTAGIDAVVATHTITIERLAVEARIGSDQQADGYASLGLSGSFTLNGVTVAVTATDSLNDIADKINYGEDTNKNGRLDKYGEDLNGNNQLDVYRSNGVWTGGGYAPSFTYYEDINANGIIDGGEDANNNDALDGGTAESGAAASVVNGRLIITNMRGGDSPITLTESGSVMTSLGFFRVDDNNQKILKTPDENSYNRVGRTASLTIDGQAVSSPYNTVTNALPGLTAATQAKLHLAGLPVGHRGHFRSRRRHRTFRRGLQRHDAPHHRADLEPHAGAKRRTDTRLGPPDRHRHPSEGRIVEPAPLVPFGHRPDTGGEHAPRDRCGDVRDAGQKAGERRWGAAAGRRIAGATGVA